MRVLQESELVEFDARVRAMEAKSYLRRPGRVGEMQTDGVIGHRFGIKVGDVRRLKAERAIGAVLE